MNANLEFILDLLNRRPMEDFFALAKKSSPTSSTTMKKRSLKGRFLSVESRFELVQLAISIKEIV